MKSNAAQNKEILSTLKKGDVLTPYDAYVRFDCLRLSARIYDLRKEGHNITTTPLKVGIKTVAAYSYKSEKHEC